MFGEEIFEQIKDKPVVCCGTIIGSYEKIIEFFTHLTSLTIENPNLEVGCDQAALNYIVHRKLLDIRLCDNNSGPFLTLHHTSNYDLKQNRLLLRDGDIASIVHQYDRYSQLVDVFSNLADAKFATPKFTRLMRKATNKIFKYFEINR